MSGSRLLFFCNKLSSFSNYGSLFHTLKFFSPRFIHQQVERKIPARLLTEKTSETIEIWKKKDHKELRETRFVDSLEEVKLTEYIYGNKVALLVTEQQNPLGIVIRHPEFAKQQKIVFEFLWKKAEK